MKTIRIIFSILAVSATFVIAACKKEGNNLGTSRGSKEFFEQYGPHKQTVSFNSSELPKTISLAKVQDHYSGREIDSIIRE